LSNLGDHIKESPPLFFKNSQGQEKVKFAKCKLQSARNKPNISYINSRGNDDDIDKMSSNSSNG
jgi:hypothetical protein